jgi:hypothetical protein
MMKLKSLHPEHFSSYRLQCKDYHYIFYNLTFPTSKKLKEVSFGERGEQEPMFNTVIKNAFQNSIQNCFQCSSRYKNRKGA